MTPAAAGRTIYALSSGSPPAAIAVIRLSGPDAADALVTLAGALPEPRRATLGVLRDPKTREVLDRALLLYFPAPHSATGEEVAELHLHGGRAVVAGILDALSQLSGLRPAEPGEFTRRAFDNGRIDLTEAEGLADLLLAETQSQRRAALALAGGALSRQVQTWQERLLGLAAGLEAVLDFSDEGDVDDALPADWRPALDMLSGELDHALAAPSAERLREGVRVVIAGPPNSGKSSLLNWLVGRQAAITSAIAGTTRDLIEAPTAIRGTPFLLVDTAGLRDSADEIESIGVGLARETLTAADLVLWLGEPAEAPVRDRTIIVRSKADLIADGEDPDADVSVSAETGGGMQQLVDLMIARAQSLLPAESELAIHARHREAIADCLRALREACQSPDLVIASENLRLARRALDRITGRAGVEDMLDRLFGSFCIGK